MNKISIIGNLTRDPEIKITPNGTKVAKLTVAVTRRFNREITDFIPVVAWRGLADNCEKYLEKGRKVAVTGDLQTRSTNWTSPGGDTIKRTFFEINADDIEFLSPHDKQENAQPVDPVHDGDNYIGSLIEDENLPF